MKYPGFRILALLTFLAISTSSIAQDGANKLSLEDIYRNGSYPTRYYRSVRWMEDARHYTTLEFNPQRNCSEIISYDAKSGERMVLVGADQLRADPESDPLRIRDYQWSADNKKLLLFTNTRRLWRYHTRGDYWVLDLISGKLEQVGSSLKPASLMFAKFSPDDSRVAYVSKHNIYVENLEKDKAKGMK